METILAAFRRVYDHSQFGGVALTLVAVFIAATIAMMIAGGLRSWRRGERMKSLIFLAFGALDVPLSLQPAISQLGLYSSGVRIACAVTLGLGAALGVIALWAVWRRAPQSGSRGVTILWAIVFSGLLLVGAAQTFLPGALPRPV